MTQTQTRPAGEAGAAGRAARSVRPDDGTESGRPVVLGAVIGTGAVALAGLVVCSALAVVAWLGDTAGGVSTAMRVGGLVWLAAHRTGVAIPGGHIGLAPLGLTLGIVVGLYRAGRMAGRTCVVDTAGDVVRGAVAMGLTYGVVGAAIAVVTGGRSVHVGIVAAALVTALLALAFGTAGLLVGSGWWPAVRSVVPMWARRCLTPIAVMPAAVVTIGLAVVVLEVVLQFGRLQTLHAALAPGRVGTVVVVLGCVALAPNAALFAVSFLAGPGFRLGTGTVVSPSGSALGPLPTFPLLGTAGTTHAGALYPVWVVALFPVAVGAVGGVLVVRRRFERAGYGEATLAAVTSAAGAGLVLAGLLAVAGGSIGPGRLADVGPQVWATVGILAAGLAVGGLVTALPLTAWRSRTPNADDTASDDESS